MTERKSTPAFVFHGFYERMLDLASEVADLTQEDWNRFSYRQKNIVGHKQTRTVPLIFDPVKKTRKIEHWKYQSFEQHLTLLHEILGMEVRRANLVELAPLSEIAMHYDKGDFLSRTKRIHLPITTNDSCIFVVGEETKHIPVGEMWEINNTGMRHGVRNGGTTSRIHLIVDVQ